MFARILCFGANVGSFEAQNDAYITLMFTAKARHAKLPPVSFPR